MLGDGSQTNPYIITQPSDFDVVRNNTTTETNVYYELGNDIDFNNVLTKSLNFDSNNAKFTSSIDGKGYTIKNLNFHNPTVTIGGFFGRITESSTIKNIKFENMTTTVHNPTATVAYASLLAHFIQGTMENIYLHGAINFSGYYQAISAIGNRLIPASNTYVKNVYVDVDINLKNVQPRLATNNDLAITGFASALYASTTNANAISDIVVNSRLNVVSSNLANAKINPVSYFAQNDVVYPRLYGNTTTFTPTIMLDTITSLTDETIKQPLDLDSTYWEQQDGYIPQLKSFAIKHSHNVVLNTSFLPPSVLLNVSKSKKGINPLDYEKHVIGLSKDVKKHINIESGEYDVTVNVIGESVKSFKFEIPFNPIPTYLNTTTSILRHLAFDIKPFNVNLDTEYHKDENTLIYAYTYSLVNPTCTYSIENQSYCEVK